MSIFDEQAIEAAARILCKTECPQEDCPCCWPIGVRPYVNAKAALEAAETSLRERGKLRDGAGVIWDEGLPTEAWICDTPNRPIAKPAVPVAIIRIDQEQPPPAGKDMS